MARRPLERLTNVDHGVLAGAPRELREHDFCEARLGETGGLPGREATLECALDGDAPRGELPGGVLGRGAVGRDEHDGRARRQYDADTLREPARAKGHGERAGRMATREGRRRTQVHEQGLATLLEPADRSGREHFERQGSRRMNMPFGLVPSGIRFTTRQLDVSMTAIAASLLTWTYTTFPLGWAALCVAFVPTTTEATTL